MNHSQATEFLKGLELDEDRLPAADINEEAFAEAVAAAPEYFNMFQDWEQKRQDALEAKGAAVAGGTECPLSRDQLISFAGSGATLKFEINGAPILGRARSFATGSVGFNVTGRTVCIIDGQECPAQVTGNVVLIGTKGTVDSAHPIKPLNRSEQVAKAEEKAGRR